MTAKPLKQLAWLVDLVQRPRDEIRLELRKENARYALGFYGAGPVTEKLLNALNVLKTAFRQLASSSEAGAQYHGPRWSLTLMPAAPITITREDELSEALFESDDDGTAVLLRADELVRLEGTRIRECPECLRLFLKQKGAKFCSARCTQRDNVRRFREELGREEVNRRQREYYALSKKGGRKG